MSDTSLPEAVVWHDTIHQAEDGDPVNGGVPDRASRSGGPNIAAKMLADRTRWLRQKVQEALDALSAGELLAAIKTVDGTGSGLDADTLDGLHAAAFVQSRREGAGNGLNADMVDGRHASEFALTSREGAGNGLNADTVDGLHAFELGGTAGDIKAFLAATPPQGWLKCDGTELARADFPALVSRAGPYLRAGGTAATFRLPDLRGEFLRGADDGRGVDPGRVPGSSQGDLLRDHRHGLGAHSTYRDAGSSTDGPGDSNDASTSNVTIGVLDGLGGAETRPRNVAVHFAIKF